MSGPQTSRTTASRDPFGVAARLTRTPSLPTQESKTTPRRPNEFVEARASENARLVIQDRRAARVVASNSVDAEDCMSLLLMLGLTGCGSEQDDAAYR